MVTKAAFKITVGYGNYKGGCLTCAEEPSVFLPPSLLCQCWMLMILSVWCLRGRMLVPGWLRWVYIFIITIYLVLLACVSLWLFAMEKQLSLFYFPIVWSNVNGTDLYLWKASCADRWALLFAIAFKEGMLWDDCLTVVKTALSSPGLKNRWVFAMINYGKKTNLLKICHGSLEW